MSIRNGLVLGLTLCLVAPTRADDPVPANAPLRWWKGNLHTHTLWSDGNDFPEMVAEWYRSRGYNFLALSDHNILSEGQKWMKHADIVRRGGGDALKKYRSRFSDHWVETRGDTGSSNFEVRLKPLDEFRSLVEERGQFIMIPGEEISDRAEGKPIHLNATNVKQLIRPVGGETVVQTINNNARAVQEQARRLGRRILVHLNHPNFGWAVTGEELAAATAEKYYEVYNGHPAVGHLGDEHHPSVERLWDIANTLRITVFKTDPLLGLAVDDCHKYHGRPGSRPGRGWVMVQSRRLTPDSIVEAIEAGRFYASSGVTLETVHYDAPSKTLRLEIQGDGDATYQTQFIGTLRDHDDKSSPRADKEGKARSLTRRYSDEIGKVLKTVDGRAVEYQLTGKELYVRAVVTSSRPHPDPSFSGQRLQAWTQPVGWRRR